MKYNNYQTSILRHVAPLVGAWIEITWLRPPLVIKTVAPLVGAWIEINNYQTSILRHQVAPLVGAWIEIVPVLYFLRQLWSLLL